MKALRQVFYAILGMISMVILGVIGFTLTEGYSLFDALWLTVITTLTVGYGDMYPVTYGGRLFALIIIPLSVGFAAYGLGAVTAAIMEGTLSERVRRRRMEKHISKLKGHIIVCGYGRVGQQVALQLQDEQVPYIVVDMNPQQYKELKDTLYVEGDATEDEILRRAGIASARGLVSALPDDANNVYVTLTAKELNPDIQVVARGERSNSAEKLLRSGADRIINPASIGGRRMAMSILKPAYVDFVENILHSPSEEYRVEEIVVEAKSSLQGTVIREAQIHNRFGVNIVAIKRDEKMITSNLADERLAAGDLLIVFGTRKQLEHFERAGRS